MFCCFEMLTALPMDISPKKRNVYAKIYKGMSA